MTEEIFIEIMKGKSGSWEGDNAYEGLTIIKKYTNNLIQRAGHDVIWSEDIVRLIENGITEEDVKELRRLNWMIKDDAYNDIKTFIKNAGDIAIQEAINENGLFKLGMDIWFTRNGHGAGFFDHSYENEDLLIIVGEKLKPKDLYVGDDGKLYFM